MPMTRASRRAYKAELQARRAAFIVGEFPCYRWLVCLLDRANAARKSFTKRYKPTRKKWLKKKHPHREG